jgi:HD-GYP domain-containing protein (c-di-GMP phosphodiesterase class II)
MSDPRATALNKSVIYNKYPMVKLVTYLIGLYDPYGVDHSERTAALSASIGITVGMSRKALENLELAALLHDIGKLAIPESTRAKPGRLTEAEMLLMRQHPAMGLKILQHMNGSISPDVHLAIFHHHEDYGGTGYPAGLKGDMIPLESRIIRIADSFDALTYLRGYRPPLSKIQAVELMVADQQQSRLYDPGLLNVFLDVVKA